jgi:hypothetical protein
MAEEILRNKHGPIPPEHWDGEATPRDKPFESYSPEFEERFTAETARLKEIVERTKRERAAAATPPAVPPKPEGAP